MQQVKATRMEYLKLRKRLKTARRGYKLLKEKRDGLMKKFMEIIREARDKRRVVEEKLATASRNFAITTSSLFQKELEEFFALPSAEINVSLTKENIMSVWIPRFQYEIQGDFKVYSDFSAPLGMEECLREFWQALEVMLQLAGIEHSSRLLSFEIEKTRRRVNALEYMIIPRLQNKLKYIASKLDEQERAEKIIRLKIKAMLVG